MRRVQLEDLLASPVELSRLGDILGRGGVAAIPTETFYGLAADPMNERGVARIFELKGRDDGKPLPVLFSAREQLERLGIEAPPPTLDRFFSLWPAPLTVVLPLRAPIAASRGGSTLAVRLPSAPDVRALLSVVGPMTGTSANRSAGAPLALPDEVARLLGPDLDLLVDGGPTPGGRPSTIIDGTVEPPRLLRAGAFAWTDSSTNIADQS